MMKNLLIILCVAFSACSVAPKNFSMRYMQEDTGLKDSIDIEGYYVSEHGCDSTFFSVYMFYADGLFTSATTSEVPQELINCFVNGGREPICQYPLWGAYELVGDTIKTQTIRTDGGGCVVFRDYLITKDRKLINISDYVEAKYTLIAAMKNYPSFYENKCQKEAEFFPVNQKRSKDECPFIRRRWFYK